MIVVSSNVLNGLLPFRNENSVLLQSKIYSVCSKKNYYVFEIEHYSKRGITRFDKVDISLLYYRIKYMYIDSITVSSWLSNIRDRYIGISTSSSTVGIC